ncbi:MAG: TIGR03000 domain-containing protein [Gemmataceae bacterium]|nr:TIGR03000 domain-containing protein [Gemmataceae bacterium]
MYSVVMLAAMSAAPETPEFFGLFGRCFCARTYVSYGCGGCFGCTGCWGYRTSCFGCGGCWGTTVIYSYGCTGCWGCTGCTGCWGYAPSGCIGCTGCYGTGYSVGCYGGYVTGTTVGYSNYTLGGTVPAYEYAAPVTTPTTPASYNQESRIPSSKAAVVVRLPADAKLLADGASTNLTGAERRFLTPDLQSGKDYQYTLTAEFVRDGKLVSESKKVVVRAGIQTVVEFGNEEKSSSTVAVILPEKARLFVDDQITTARGGKHEFRTPELPTGKTFTYTFRAEVTRDGKTETQTQRVVFKAGEPLTVDFSDIGVAKVASK